MSAREVSAKLAYALARVAGENHSTALRVLVFDAAAIALRRGERHRRQRLLPARDIVQRVTKVSNRMDQRVGTPATVVVAVATEDDADFIAQWLQIAIINGPGWQHDIRVPKINTLKVALAQANFLHAVEPHQAVDIVAGTRVQETALAVWPGLAPCRLAEERPTLPRVHASLT